jgi:hypothetical protein
MDAILGYRPQSRFAIIEMDKSVLESARSAIVRSYQEFDLLDTILDAAALAGMRALTEPFDLRHITRQLVRSLVAEGFNAFWDKSDLHGPYAIKVSWRAALNHVSQARRRARKLRISTTHADMHEKGVLSPTNCTEPRAVSPSPSCCAPSVVWDNTEPLLGLEMLANPEKARVAHEASEIMSPR